MNLQELSPEYKMLICCARKTVNPEMAQRISNLAKSNLDWAELIKKAEQHKLIPLLYLNLSLYASEFVPADIHNHLKKISDATAKCNLIFTAELIKIVNLLKNAGIIAIPFKGPALAALAYDDIALRQFGDLDIFVVKDQFLQARQVLLDNGYRLAYKLEHINFDLLTKTGRHDIFITNNEITLELHWRIENVASKFKEEHVKHLLYLETINIDLNGFKISSFTIENLILFLVMHCANHRCGWLSLLCDIADLSEKFSNVNWKEIVAKAGELHIKKILGTTFYLINNILEFELTDEIQALINSMPEVKKLVLFVQKKIIFSESPMKPAIKMFFEITKKDTLWKGISEILFLMVRPTSKEFGTILPKRLSFLYFVVRPFSIIHSAVSSIFAKKT